MKKERGRDKIAGTSQKAAAERRLAFVRAYLINGHNATQAAITAGFSEKTAGSQGFDLLKRPEVQALIQNESERAGKASGLSVDRWIEEVRRLAFCDARQLFDKEGNLKKIHEIDDDTAAAIAGVEAVDLLGGTGEDRKVVGYLKKIKLNSKTQALDMAAKHLSLYAPEKHQVAITTLEELDERTALNMAKAIEKQKKAGQV